MMNNNDNNKKIKNENNNYVQKKNWTEIVPYYYGILQMIACFQVMVNLSQSVINKKRFPHQLPLPIQPNHLLMYNYGKLWSLDKTMSSAAPNFGKYWTFDLCPIFQQFSQPSQHIYNYLKPCFFCRF
jgi:hypothetical protein